MMCYLRNLSIFIFFLICGMHTSFAQNQQDTLRHELGFGTKIIISGLFSNSSSVPLDFLYRRKSGTGYLRLGSKISLGTLREENEYSFTNSKTLRTEVNLGKEGRVSLANRWLLNYGGELNLGYFYSKRLSKRRWYSDNLRISFSDEVKHEYTLGIRPFVGVIFKISERLFLNTEASIRSGVRRGFYFEKGYDSNGEQNTAYDKGDGDSWSFYFHTQPASNIFVYYRF